MKAFASVVVLLAIGVPLAAGLAVLYGPVGIAALLPALIAFTIADANDRWTLKRLDDEVRSRALNAGDRRARPARSQCRDSRGR